MRLAAGARLGQYEIIAVIGAGGMGEVYRARDTYLNRDIALKILPEAFAHDPERTARFRREAQTLASLNHPNIAAIHGFDESAPGLHALVLELVEGPTLAERIARGALPIDEAVVIASQLADALQAAHERGIIHRDLKPANIKLSEDGTVKVLDFGLAKALAPADAVASLPADVTLSPTLTMPATRMGVILGTAAYMSPEQARGKVVDRRADIWAFGCVLYEMLTGRRAFDPSSDRSHGASSKGEIDEVSDTLAAILRADPDWSALPANLPGAIRIALQHCLEKDRKKRIADISTVSFLLKEHATLDVAAAIPPPSAARLGRRFAVAATLLVGAGVSAAIWMVDRSPAVPPNPMRFSITTPLNQPSGISQAADRTIAVSPDGTRLVYLTNSNQLMVRAIDQLDAVALTGTAAARAPFFSPDGRWVGFMTPTELRKVSISGGPPITVCRLTGPGARGATWGPDGTIVFTTGDPYTGLLSVPAGGGEPTILTRPDRSKGEADHVAPSMLPDGRHVLFTIAPQGLDPLGAQVALFDLTTRTQKTLIRGAGGPHYISTGHLVFNAGTALRAVPFDLKTLEVTGDPIPVVDAVASVSGADGNYDVSGTGLLAYVPGGAVGGAINTRRSLLWVDRAGREESIPFPPRTYTYPRISPDGTRVAVDIRDQESDIWIGDFVRRTLTRFTFSRATDFYPVWMPDGSRIIFQTGQSADPRSGGYAYWQRADGTGDVEQLTDGATTPHYGYSVSPDGRSFLFNESSRDTALDIALLPLASATDARPASAKLLIHSPFNEVNAEIAPDGHWVAYQSNESGQEEIYVRPFPNVESGRWQVSAGGGTRPLWARSGRELFYLDAGGLLTAVNVATTPSFSVSNPTRVLNTRYFSGFGGGGQNVAGRTYDISPDGKRFLMIKDVAPDQSSASASIVVVVNWFEDLKARMAH